MKPNTNNLVTVRNPHPPNAIPKRKRQAYDPIPQRNPAVTMTPEEWWEDQDKKQAAHGAAIAKMLEAKKADEKRKKMLLTRGMPQVSSVEGAIQAAVNAGFEPGQIPTKGNT